jgi:hypothetical protein
MCRWIKAFKEEELNNTESYTPVSYSHGYWLMRGASGVEDAWPHMIIAPDEQETFLEYGYTSGLLTIKGANGNMTNTIGETPLSFFEGMVQKRIVGGSFSHDVAYYSRDREEEGHKNGLKEGYDSGYTDGYTKGEIDGTKYGRQEEKWEMKSKFVEFLDELFDADFVDRDAE